MKKFLQLSVALMLLPFVVLAQVPFTPLDTNYQTSTLVIPASPLKYDTLFIGNHHMVYNPTNGQSALAKQNHDFTGLIQTGNNKSYVIVNHEVSNTKNAKLGDGGGQTVFYMQRNKGKWAVRKRLYNKEFVNVDFSALGGTNTNCGGATTPKGTTLTAEEFPVGSNGSLWAGGNGYSDTTDYVVPAGNGVFSGKTLKRWQNLGYMVEANPTTGNALRKCYEMGRFSHEGGVAMKDGKTVFLTDDFVPSVFFKFVADNKDDYSTGSLYAFKEGANGQNGQWLQIPRVADSLMDARNVALRMGATIYTRWEWVVSDGGNKLYIAETGADVADYNSGIALGGVPTYYAYYLDTLYGGVADNKLTDRYGRILEFTISTNSIKVFLEGGSSTDMKTNLASPDGLVYGKIKGKEYLIINEDLIGTTFNRMPDPATPGNRYINEIFVLDLDVKNPTVDDLHRFAIGPFGCETTGGVLTKNGDTYVVNVQHPSSSNPFPFNNSTTVAISGFSNFVEALVAKDEAIETAIAVDNAKATAEGNTEVFNVYPNPASRVLHFNRTTDVAVYNNMGQQVMVERQVSKIDISGLTPGVYYVQSIDGQTQKIVIE